MKCQIALTNQGVRREADSKKSEYLQECSVTRCWQPDETGCKTAWLPNRQKGFADRGGKNPTKAICLLLHFPHSSRCHGHAKWHQVPCSRVSHLQQGHRAEGVLQPARPHPCPQSWQEDTFAQHQPDGISRFHGVSQDLGSTGTSQ